MKIRERWTQSSVWYNLRPILIDNGFEPKESWSKTRQYVQGIINKVCKEQWNVPREALGIIASARAVIYYNDQSYRVHLDAVEELAKLGTDIIFVEKEGIVDVLTSFADKYGIALVNTQGRLTEYGKDLIDAAKKSGAKVSILTDYDAFGIEIAKGARIEIPRIGIDIDNTLKFFQQHGFPELTAEDVEEGYEPSIHTSDVEYLKTKRIELDSILAKVGAEELWKYIMHQLTQQTFFSSENENEERGRDYTRVISKTENRDLYPVVINDFLDYVERLTDSITLDKWTEIKSSLRNVKWKLFQLYDKNIEIKEELRTVVAEDEGLCY